MAKFGKTIKSIAQKSIKYGTAPGLANAISDKFGVNDKIAGALGYEKKGSGGGVGEGNMPSPQDQLAGALADYRDIDKNALEGATKGAKAAGTYAETPEFQQGLQAEAGAEARGMKYAQLSRINAIRKQLGLPEATDANVLSV